MSKGNFKPHAPLTLRRNTNQSAEDTHKLLLLTNKFNPCHPKPPAKCDVLLFVVRNSDVHSPNHAKCLLQGERRSLAICATPLSTSLSQSGTGSAVSTNNTEWAAQRWLCRRCPRSVPAKHLSHSV